MQITKTERQKHDPTCFSVFVDGEYAFSCKEKVINEFDIVEGKNIKELPLKEIGERDEYLRAYSYCCKSILRSEKSEKQIRDLLLKKNFSTLTIEKVIEKLKSSNLVDDLSYAYYIADSVKGTGKKGIIYKLKQKGISDEIIDEVTENISEDDQINEAFLLAKKRIKANDDIYKQKERIKRYLFQRGFEWDIINEAVEKCFNEEEI